MKIWTIENHGSLWLRTTPRPAESTFPGQYTSECLDVRQSTPLGTQPHTQSRSIISSVWERQLIVGEPAVEGKQLVQKIIMARNTRGGRLPWPEPGGGGFRFGRN